MDIQKQKNLYLAKLLEQEVIKQDEFDDLVFKPEINAFHSNYLSSRFMDNINFGWSAWQAAKAHEAEKLKGCVLVPVQCPDPDFADSLFDELSKKAIGEFGDDLLIHFSDIDEEKIWALMVEAAKAQAVPEGFVVVPKEPTDKTIAHMINTPIEVNLLCDHADTFLSEGEAYMAYKAMIEAQEQKE